MKMMRILALGFVVLGCLTARGRTDDKVVLSRIAFGSCARQDKAQPIWDAIVATQPDIYLSLGDTIYGDTEDMAVLKKKYDMLAAIPGWQKLTKTCPILATWDDHDYGVNDGGAEYPKKDESQQLFLDFFGIAKDSPRRSQKGVYHAECFGPPDKRVQIILLDTRYFRSPLKKKSGKPPFGEGPYEPSPDTKATMLGEAQWQWLEEQLKVPAKVRILVSSIQLVPQDHGWEKWMNFPYERDRLYKLIKDTRAAGVVCISGDRHLAELSMMDAGIGYPLYDLTSSGLTEGSQKWRKLEVNRHRVATMNWGNNFGMIALDWSKDDPLIRLQIRASDAEVTIQEKLPLSLLQPGAIKSTTAAGIVRINGMVMTAEVVKQLMTKEVTLQMKVVATGATKNGDLVFLNSYADRNHDDNFTVVLDKKAQGSLAKAGIALPRTHFEGKTIRVVGTLSTFARRPQIMLSDAQNIQIVKQEPVIFEPGAKLKVKAEGESGGEGPAWHPKLGVFTSGGDGHMHLLGLDGKSRIFRKNAGTNGLLFDREGNLVSCDSVARRVSRTDPHGKVTVLTEKYEGKRYNNPNDLTIDSNGRIYFSDPRYGSRDGMEILDDNGRTIEGVYRIDTDNKVSRIIGRELDRPNGVLVSADDKYLFVADNNNSSLDGARKLWRFDLKKNGTVDFTSRKMLHDWGTGRGPDGIKQDGAGRLYVAAGLNKPNPPFEPAKDKKGGIYVFTPEGKLLAFLSVPRDEVTNCAFGGVDLKTLYITGGGTLYSIRTTTPGRVLYP